MKIRHHYTICIGLILLASVSATAQAEQAGEIPVLYKLTENSTYQSGCFPPCECAITPEMPIRGTFSLTPTGFDGLFHTYNVTDVNWRVSSVYAETNNELIITGSGTYKRGGEFALTHQLTLDLKVGNQPVQHFDSGLVVGGAHFPKIKIVISINQMYCNDTVIKVDAQPYDPSHPRHAYFVLHPGESSVEFSLFVGGTRSKLLGSIRLYLGDPDVPVIAIPGMVGLSVDGADLTAPDFEPDSPALPEPLHMIQDPKVRSIGSWNTLTGAITFELHLISPDGNLPVPQPLHLSGTLTNAILDIQGNNGNVPDGSMSIKIKAVEVSLPPPPIDVWFSTELDFNAGTISPPAEGITLIGHGDLLSRRGHIVQTNHQLTARLGIMPIVPLLGLDAVALGPRGRIWFSFEEEIEQIWSETLARWLKHGDLLSNDGRVILTNEQLLARFIRMPPVIDAGLDAVSRAPNRDIFFSTEQSFFSEALGCTVGHGDLLSHRGRIVQTNQQLLQNFDIVDLTMGPMPADYGLDAAILRPHKEIWFSTEMGFHVRDPLNNNQLRSISDGDLLSTRGYVVARNLDLVSAFGPVEDLDNFGLDAITLVATCHIGDFDYDGDVDRKDFAGFQGAISGPATASQDPEFGDLDGDGDVDQDDFGIFQRCISGQDKPADPNCAD